MYRHRKKGYGAGKSFFMCEYHRLKAMLFNLSLVDLLKNTSMLLSIFRDSILLKKYIGYLGHI
jgi:hypothetical protein